MEFKDQDLRIVLNRALRSVLIAVAVGIPIIWFAWGWQSMLLFVVGGAIAATGVLEWRQVMGAVLVRLGDPNADPKAESNPDPAARPKSLGPILSWFFVRLVAVVGVLYVSLRSLEGKIAALIIGIALALLALFIEAFQLFRGWSA
jgi:hypothetical protein